jgi:2-oxoglutarate dehydrogenase E1 component
VSLDGWQAFLGANRGYVEELYERFQQNPESVDARTRAWFEEMGPPPALPVAAPSAQAGPGQAAGALDAVRLARAVRLLEAVRDEGHLYARIDPLQAAPGADGLRPERFGLSADDLRAMPSSVLIQASGMPLQGANGLEAYGDLLRRYAGGPIGYEFSHLTSTEERAFLEAAVADSAFLAPLAPEGRRSLLKQLTAVEGLERYLHTTFPGVKRFSIEGVDALVPMLDEVVSRALEAGVQRVAIGMAHRGRLNVLAHILDKPYRAVIAEFEGHDEQTAEAHAAAGESGDVKYHLGWRRVVKNAAGREAEIRLLNNPSHLEVVDPVVLGVARAGQDERTGAGAPRTDHGRAVAVTVHGDSAFPGEGVVAETLNLAHLRGYDVGGTVHIITNNQIGFTTDVGDARSTHYASDPAKGYDMPIVHVNADEPEACVAAISLAWAFRARFGRSFMIDVVGYRRWGHNEGDEPAFTQPAMYAIVRPHPTVRALYAERLAADGVVSAEEAEAMVKAVNDSLAAARKEGGQDVAWPAPPTGAAPSLAAPTAERLRAIGRALFAWPKDLKVNARLARTLGRRTEAMDKGEGIDWGFAETLAFGTLLEDGVPIRLMGQDSERGTFAQRHLVLHDEQSGRRFAPLCHLPAARATFDVHNSPLSETAAMGFEYGYSVAAPETLVLWEAQYGDFANVGQTIVDQFVSAARAKWGERASLVLLLPHGYEGQGPEHSSARLERYLQLAAEDNLVVAYPTSAAQYFHLLREHAGRLGQRATPLVVMSPKSLLRHPLAASRLDELTGGAFQAVVDDPEAEARAAGAGRLVLASGKVGVEYLAAREKEGGEAGALVRLERLYPFPHAELAALLERYPRVSEVVWLQEEPRNMGAWSFVAPYLEAVLPRRLGVRYVGPAARSAPATGYAALHAVEMRRILADARAPGAERSAEAVR